MNRTQRATTAAETVRILDAGRYRPNGGSDVDIAQSLRNSVAATRIITPAEWPDIVGQARAAGLLPGAAVIEVTGETTLTAARRHVVAGRDDTLALNFASAKNAGGGFLSGSLAQEESLAIASGLYKSLLAGEVYYSANRRTSSKLYTDHAILSPHVPVFRDDAGALLDRPYLLSFLTMPAPNRGAIAVDSPDRHRISDTLRRRISYVLAVAATQGHRTLVLGAWGCGVFRNDPAEVADLFAESLFGPDAWAQRFDLITFAVYDRTADGEILAAFKRRFANVPAAKGCVA